MVAGLLTFLLLQAGRGRLFPDFNRIEILFLLFVLMAALVGYAIYSREK
jgi:hypothetical protein